MKKHLYFVLWYFSFVYWFIRRPQSYGAEVIVEDGKNILLVRHTYGHRKAWGLPGGHKKHAESFKETAERELKEEVGLDIPLKKLGMVKLIEDYRHTNDAVFLGQHEQQTISMQEAEIKEYKWWPKDNLPEDLFPSAEAAIKLYLNK